MFIVPSECGDSRSSQSVRSYCRGVRSALRTLFTPESSKAVRRGAAPKNSFRLERVSKGATQFSKESAEPPNQNLTPFDLSKLRGSRALKPSVMGLALFRDDVTATAH